MDIIYTLLEILLLVFALGCTIIVWMMVLNLFKRNWKDE